MLCGFKIRYWHVTVYNLSWLSKWKKHTFVFGTAISTTITYNEVLPCKHHHRYKACRVTMNNDTLQLTKTYDTNINIKIRLFHLEYSSSLLINIQQTHSMSSASFCISLGMHTVPTLYNICPLVYEQCNTTLFRSLWVGVKNLDMNGRVVACTCHGLSSFIRIFRFEVIH